MPHYNIEKGVEMPQHKAHTGRSKNQDLIDMCLTMEIGDSFTIPNHKRQSVESVFATLRKRQGVEMKWSMRKEDNVTTRIWRVV